MDLKLVFCYNLVKWAENDLMAPVHQDHFFLFDENEDEDGTFGSGILLLIRVTHKILSSANSILNYRTFSCLLLI